MDLKEFPEEILPSYGVSEEELDAFYGKGNWRRLPDETFKRLRHEPESWTVEVHTVEVHTVEVYVGTDGRIKMNFSVVNVQKICFGTVLLHHHYWHLF